MTAPAPFHNLAKFFRATPAASPVDQFIAERLKSAPGSRLALSTLWRAWQRHAHAFGHPHGKRSELVAAVRRAHPEARRVKARSGIDVHPGEHLTGLWIR